MTSLRVENNRLKSPAYYAPDDQNIRPVQNESVVTRIFYAALPFAALHQPFGRIITLVMDTTRTCSSFSQLVEKQNYKELVKTSVAVAALAGTFFLHPLGLCLASLYDLGFDLTAIVNQLQMGRVSETCYALLSMCQHLFYLGTMLIGSVEVIALSLLFQMAAEIIRSRKEFQKGNFIEGVGHLLMSIVRFSQAVPYAEKVCDSRDVCKEASHQLGGTLLKVRNHAALFFYSLSGFFVRPIWEITGRWVATIPLYKDVKTPTSQKICSAAQSAFATMVLWPFALGGLVMGQVCHFSAFLLCPTPYLSLKGSGTVKKIIDKSLSFFQLNCCLTSGGFSRMFGGVVLPNHERVRAIGKMIRENHPDLVCLQEVSDWDDAYGLYRELVPDYAEFYFHMGATPCVLQNNSGLFVASKVAIDNPELHGFSEIQGTESMVNKCFFVFSTQIAHFITTHLSPSSDDLHPKDAEMRVRAEEQNKIYLAACRRMAQNKKPLFVAGDLNISNT